MQLQWKILVGSFFAYCMIMFAYIFSTVNDPKVFKMQINECYRKALMAFNAPIIVDPTGEYRILHWPCSDLARTGHDGHDNTTLVSQCSVEQIHYLFDLRLRWQGQISLAIFIGNTDQLVPAVAMLMMVHLCSPSTLKSVYIHLVLSFFETVDVPKIDISNCNGFNSFLRQQQQTANYQFKVLYPNNILRNVALDASTTNYIFLVDIDMIPATTLYDELERFIREQTSGSLLAYVVPVFEVKEGSPIPTDRASLLDMISEGNARPFYNDICQKCQQQTNYSAWYDLSGFDRFGVGYMVTWFDAWEPFYILPQSAPRYDERFKQYGFNRISQSCELYVAGYNFAVLNNAFLLHYGFKTSTSFHVEKDAEQAKNRMLFRTFKLELMAYYLNGKHRC